LLTDKKNQAKNKKITVETMQTMIRYSQTHFISHRLMSQSAYCHINFYPQPTPVVIKGHWLRLLSLRLLSRIV